MRSEAGEPYHNLTQFLDGKLRVINEREKNKREKVYYNSNLFELNFNW